MYELIVWGRRTQVGMNRRDNGPTDGNGSTSPLTLATLCPCWSAPFFIAIHVLLGFESHGIPLRKGAGGWTRIGSWGTDSAASPRHSEREEANRSVGRRGEETTFEAPKPGNRLRTGLGLSTTHVQLLFSMPCFLPLSTPPPKPTNERNRTPNRCGTAMNSAVPPPRTLPSFSPRGIRRIQG